jgi:hypothetical protein
MSTTTTFNDLGGLVLDLIYEMLEPWVYPKPFNNNLQCNYNIFPRLNGIFVDRMNLMFVNRMTYNHFQENNNLKNLIKIYKRFSVRN